MTTMKDTELDTYFPLLHSMLRATPKSPDELARSREVMEWSMRHVAEIGSVLDEDESHLFDYIVGHWEDYSEGPSRLTLEVLVRKDKDPEPLLAILDHYDKYLPHLPVIDSIDVLTVLKTRQASWRKQQFLHTVHQARIIAASGSVDSKRDPVEDACDFLRQWLYPAGDVTGEYVDLQDYVDPQVHQQQMEEDQRQQFMEAEQEYEQQQQQMEEEHDPLGPADLDDHDPEVPASR